MSVLGSGLRHGLRELVTAARNKSLATRMTKRCGARSEELLLGGRYEVERLIGRGSHGLVFAASDRALEREVAIKVFGLASDQDIYNEARALACVNHPNVVALYDVGHSDGCTFLVMALINGWTIAERVQMARLACRGRVVHCRGTRTRGRSPSRRGSWRREAQQHPGRS